VVGKTAAPPSSAIMRGVKILRVATLRKTSTYMYQCVGGLVAHVPHPPNSSGISGECMALAPHLRMVVWPHKFWPHLPEKYDGTVKPTEFL
jgi:hypothetical protein